MGKLLYCVHELLYQSCNICSIKSREEIIKEISEIFSEIKTKNSYDYQDKEEEEIEYEDPDFDIE